MDNYPDVLRIAQAHPQVYASVGVHPNERDTSDPSVEELVTMAADGRVDAIGETGLDYFHGLGELEWKRDRIRRHIRAARESVKPLIIHSREAKADTIR